MNQLVSTFPPAGAGGILEPAAAGLRQRDAQVPILTRYIGVLYRRRWIIAAAVLVALLAGVAITMLTTPVYQASATVEISREGNQMVELKSAEPRTSAMDQEFYETQYGLLRSRSLAERVARELNLPNNENFFAMNDVEPPSGAGARAERLKRASTILLDSLTIRPARLSRLVDIRVASPDPVLAARIANTWANNYIRFSLERRYEAASYARTFLQEQLEQTRRRLEASERELVAYAGQQGILNFQSAAPEDGDSASQRSLASEEIISINQELARATAARIEAQSRVQQARAASSSTQDVTNPTIAALRQRRAEAAAELARLLTQFEEGYPPVQALRAQVSELDRSIAREIGRIRSSAETNFREATARETQLKGRVEELRGDMIDLRRRSIQYNILQREVDTNRALYDGLLQRYREVGIAGGVGANNIAVVDPAEVPAAPSQPRALVNMVLALLVGLGIGVLLAIALEQIDETLNDPRTVEQLIGLPLLGTLFKVKTGSVEEALLDAKSEVSEGASTIRTSLSFATAHGLPHFLAVTSTRPAEGKTTTSLALALSIARLGRRVLLIDADMRSPSMHHIAGLPNTRGLSSFLSGNVDIDEVTQRYHDVALMTAGPRPPNPAELLSGDGLDRLKELALARFDHVVIDCPPVMGLADAPILSSAVDLLVFVVEYRATKARAARLAVERIQQAQNNVAGVVLTKFDPARAAAGYGTDYEYSYGYGYGNSEKA